MWWCSVGMLRRESSRLLIAPINVCSDTRGVKEPVLVVRLFYASDPTPVETRSCSGEGSQVLGATFVPSTSSNSALVSPLYFVNGAQVLCARSAPRCFEKRLETAAFRRERRFDGARRGPGERGVETESFGAGKELHVGRARRYESGDGLEDARLCTVRSQG